jgi:protein-disulfide isomerase
MKRYLPLAIIAIVLVAAIIAGFLMFRSAQQQNPTTPTTSQSPSASQVATASKGYVTLEEYGDYQCPPCGALHPEMKKLKAEYGDKLKFFFYNFPLTQMHKHAMGAAQAAVAAGKQGKFWEMHDLLYDNQKVWEEAEDLRPVIINFARQLNLNMDKFAQDLSSAETLNTISSDQQRGLAMGVNSTPTLFLDGQPVELDKDTTDSLRKQINAKLAPRS